MTYEQLLNTASENGLAVKEQPLIQHDGLIKGKRIAIRKDISTQAEKSCVLSEELGHHYTTVGDILDQSDPAARKQELRARLWAYDKMIGLSGIVHGFRSHCRNRHELADCLHVSEEFLQEAIDCYREKYGCSVELDGYLIVFDPSLAVIEKF